MKPTEKRASQEEAGSGQKADLPETTVRDCIVETETEQHTEKADRSRKAGRPDPSTDPVG
ncbi:MAG: hypothetical protein ACLR6B_01875 [Blautia sp.]